MVLGLAWAVEMLLHTGVDNEPDLGQADCAASLGGRYQQRFVTDLNGGIVDVQTVETCRGTTSRSAWARLDQQFNLETATAAYLHYRASEARGQLGLVVL
jgi:hypothetical protein